jgi:hypothetical protein
MYPWLSTETPGHAWLAPLEIRLLLLLLLSQVSGEDTRT